MITRTHTAGQPPVTVRYPSTGACRARNPALPQEIRSASRLGTCPRDRRADCEGAPASRRIGRDRRHHHLQPDALRARQTNRRLAVSHVGLGPASSARSKSKTACVVKRGMRLKTMGIYAALLLFACGIAEATPITYTLSYAIASDQVTGTITTDGTIGNLNPANVTSWSFTETGSNPFSISSLNPGAFILCQRIGSPNSCGLTATTSALLFDFLSNQDFLNFRSTSIGVGRPDRAAAVSEVPR